MTFNYNVPISIGTTAAPAVLDYMVVPSDFTGELSFTLMVDGKEMKVKSALRPFAVRVENWRKGQNMR